MQSGYQIYIDKQTVDQINVYRVFVCSNGSICSVNAFADHDIHGRIFQGKVAQVFTNGKAIVQIDNNAALYIERSFKNSFLDVGETVWVQAHGVSPLEIEYKNLKGTLNVALPCGPIIIYPFEPGIHISHRLKQYPEFAHNLKLQFESLAGRFGIKFRLSAKDYSYALLEKIISYTKHVWDLGLYNTPQFLILNMLMPYFLSPADIFTNDTSSCEWLASSLEHIFDISVNVKGLPSDIEFLEDAWDNACKRTLLLSNSSICIEETRACTTIDVNAGSNQAHINVNREAMEKLPHLLYQGRFGGKVVVDMLPIVNREESDRLIRIFEAGWVDIDVFPQVYGVSKMGLLEFILPRRGYPLWWINKKILKN